ncbi:MAG TPA: FxLYD domain-containing protein [Thermoanaerobaculia bacterium]|jgi:hypothetical protein
MSDRLGIVHGIALGLLALGTVAAAAPARADWLVTREGGRVETKGPWQTKGKLLVFTRAADGALASLRVSEVDLDASAKATAAAKVQESAPPAPEAPKKKLAVLTDKDFRKPAPAAGDDAKPDDGKTPANSGPVTVSGWRRTDRDDGLVIEGTVHNSTGGMIINASVEVQLYNEAGERIGTAQGLLTSTSVQPNGSVDFRANFPGVFTFADVKFQPQGIPLDMNPPAPDQGADKKPADKTPPP